jgi:hypothetical protein
MAKQDTTFDKPSHTPGTHKGEEWHGSKNEPGRKGNTATARSSTSINAKSREPILPVMPHLPPA